MKTNNLAIIDIGTSSTKLLIVCVEGGAIKKVLHKERVEEIVDEQGVKGTMSGFISEKSTRKKIEILNSFKEKIRNFDVDKTEVVSTDVLRQSSNSEEVVSGIKNQTGLDANVISQEREMELFWKGVSDDFPADMILSAIDIGGGSVQFMWGTKGNLKGHKLLRTGVFRLREELNLGDPLSCDDIERYEARINEEINELSVEFSPETPMIHGSSEVISYYQELKVPLASYEFSKTHPYQVDLEVTKDYYDRLKTMKTSERKKLAPSLPGYAHGAVLGLANVLLIAKKTGISHELPSNNNITNGIVLDMLES